MPTHRLTANPANLVVLHGRLSSEPVVRTLPSGDQITQLEITTAGSDGPRLGVPVVWSKADPLPPLAPGDAVMVCGAVRRRFYRARGVTASRTEVVADAVLPATRRSRRDLLRQMLAELVEAGPPDWPAAG